LGTLTRSSLCEAAQSVAGVSRGDAADICDRMIELIGNSLMEGETVKLTGFGTLEVRTRAERMGRNPRTGEEHTIAARRVVMLVPSANLKEKLGKS
jgi:integration host factor subunit alpha